jgi:hypothetical protein
MMRQAQDEELLLVRDGHAVALVIPFDDDDVDWYRREREPAFLESLARARRQVQERKTVRHRNLRRRMEADTSSSDNP